MFGDPKTRAKALPIRCKLVSCTVVVLSLLGASSAPPAQVSTSEFLTHCQAAPDPCKEVIFKYVKFLADGELIDQCVMQLPAGDVAAKTIGWMRDHPEYGERDWVDCLDDALAALKLCHR
jgi:hypothetical protein